MSLIGKKPIIKWFDYEIIDEEVKYRLANKEEFSFADDINEDEIRHGLYNSDFLSFEWDESIEYLTELISKKCHTGYWKATVNNFGWRSLDGHKFFMAEKGDKFLSQLLPNTDCSFNIFRYGRGFAIQNYHHDSTTGSEMYYVLPCAYETYIKNK